MVQPVVVDVTFVIAPEYPPWAGPAGAAAVAARTASSLERAGRVVEIVAPGPDGEEFMHLDEGGRLVHRVCGERSYLRKGLGAVGRDLLSRLALPVRVAERVAELALRWNRRIVEIHLVRSEGSVVVLPAGRVRAASLRPPSTPPVTLTLVVFGRGEAERTLRSLLPQVTELRSGGTATDVVVACDLSEASSAALGASSVEGGFGVAAGFGGLASQGNAGLARSTGELVVFVTSPAVAQPGFLQAHLRAARDHGKAVGVGGRLSSQAGSWLREVGQVRATGFIERNYDSLVREPQLIAQLPAPANFSVRRSVATALLGRTDWFKHDDVQALTRELFRRGGFFVHAPDAALEGPLEVEAPNRGRPPGEAAISGNG
jgi:hypothetical protein